MDRLEPHRHLEPSREEVSKREARLADERRMRLDDHAPESADGLRDVAVVAARDRAGVEEAAGVVELYPRRRWKAGERAADLRLDRAGSDRLLERVPPEVAHEAAP